MPKPVDASEPSPMPDGPRHPHPGAKHIESIAPDAEAAAIIGMDVMNPGLTYEAAQAGLRQGRVEAERLRAFWE